MRPSLPIGERSLLADPNLRRLWAAEAWAVAAESLALIAMPLLVYEITHSARMVGLIALLLIIPRVLLAPIAGLIVDRVDLRKLMIAVHIERLILVSFIPLTDKIWQIGLLAVGVAIGNSIARPAEMAVIPFVAGPERLVRSLSLIQVTNGILRILMPALGAATVSTTGAGPAFWLQSFCFIASIYYLRFLIVPRTEPIRPEAETLRAMLHQAKAEIWAGLRALKSIPIVRGITASEMLWQVAGGAMVVSGVVYTQETLDLGNRSEAAFALMGSSIGMGAVLGALVASRLEHRIGRPWLMAIGYTGPGYLMIAWFTPSMPVIYVAWFLLGLTDAWAVISFQAYLAEAIPEELRGRVYAAFGALVALASALSYYLIGLVTPRLGAPNTFALVGLIVGLGGPIMLWQTGALHSIRSQKSLRSPVSSKARKRDHLPSPIHWAPDSDRDRL